MIEQEYASLVATTLTKGQQRFGRNGKTRGLFGATLAFAIEGEYRFPLLNGRRMFYKGVFGEFAAFIRGPKHVDDFRAWDCNYWDQWAKPDGSIDLDYGNSWIDYNGVNQIKSVVESIKTNPHGRRHIIDGWRPDRLNQVDLPSCHFLYQWYVTTDGYLDMIWYQRSVDLMVGLPSDIILAQLFNLCMARETGYRPGKVIFMLGDCHIYEEHIEGAKQYLRNVHEIMLNTNGEFQNAPRFTWSLTDKPLTGKPDKLFKPGDVVIEDYEPMPAIKFEVKA